MDNSCLPRKCFISLVQVLKPVLFVSKLINNFLVLEGRRKSKKECKHIAWVGSSVKQGENKEKTKTLINKVLSQRKTISVINLKMLGEICGRKIKDQVAGRCSGQTGIWVTQSRALPTWKHSQIINQVWNVMSLGNFWDNKYRTCFVF